MNFAFNKASLYFLLKLAGLYLSWYFFHRYVLYPSGKFDDFFNFHIIHYASDILKSMGYPLFQNGTHFGIVNSAGLIVSEPCNGVSLFVTFAIFIIAFNGTIKNKLWFIPVGILLINVLNILRVVALCLIINYKPHLLEFNHSYTFTFLMYTIIFGLWIIWIKKFTNPQKVV